MDSEYELIQQIVIGDKLKRLEYLNNLRFQQDMFDNGLVIGIMEETTQLIKDITDFMRSYNTGTNDGK